MTSTRLSDLLGSVAVPEGVRPSMIEPYERTDEYADLMRDVRRRRIRKAGLRGVYADAECDEGRMAFERFQRGRGTYLWGLPGRGKTYAAAACARLAVLHEYKTRLVTAKALLDQVRAEYDGRERDALKRAERYDLLVLDDLGMERPTEWAMETISGLIDARVAEGKPIVLTSNYALGELRERWGGMEGARLVSRIAGACERVEVKGEDRRLACR